MPNGGTDIIYKLTIFIIVNGWAAHSDVVLPAKRIAKVGLPIIKKCTQSCCIHFNCNSKNIII